MVMEMSPMGWIRLVGSLKFKSLLQNTVSFICCFAKETYDFKEPTSHTHQVLM